MKIIEEKVSPMRNKVEANLGERAKQLHLKAILCDITVPWTAEHLPADRDFKDVLVRFKNAGANYVSLTAAALSNANQALTKVAAIRRQIFEYPEKYVFVEGIDDITCAKDQSKLSVGLHFQSTHPFERNIHFIEVFYKLGIRHAGLAYNERNFVGDGCHELTDSGLSRFGKMVVEEMNRVGMIVDLSHTGYRTSMEAMEISSAPVIFSHTSAKVLFDHPRNIKDDQIKACAKTGGIIGVHGVGMFLGAEKDSLVENVIRNIDYMVQKVGTAHVGIGSDFMYLEGSAYNFYYKQPHLYPEGYPTPPWDFLQPEKLPELTEGMVRLGYSEPDIRGILGENFLRVAQAVWK